jgi:hypothetical protein
MKEKKYRVTLGNSFAGGSYIKLYSPMPGLLWAELVTLMTEWGRFKQGKSGTRFDRHLEG